MEYEIIHHPQRNRFEITQDGLTAFVEYRLVGDNLDIIHTKVPEPWEGRGIAASLVKTAFDYALEHQLTPQVACSYAAAWLKRHEEYAK